MLLAFALRLYRLGYQSIWYDEGVSIHLATKDLVALTRHTAGDIHPPLYYYLLHFWILAAGQTEFAVAFLSVFFGVLITPLAYRLARGLYDVRVGLLTAILVAISPFNLWYSQEIRMYTLGAFLGLVSLWSIVRLTRLQAPASAGPGDKAPSRSPMRTLILWLGYVLSATAGLYTLYYFAFLLLFENLFVFGWWLANRVRQLDFPLSMRRWIVAQFAVLLLYLPWLPIALHQALEPPVPPWRTFAELGNVLLDSWASLAVGQSVDPNSALIWPVLSFIFALYLLGLLRPPAGKRGASVGALLAGCTFAPLATIYLLSLRTPLFHPRYAFTYSPPFYIVLAAGLAGLRRTSRLVLPISLAVVALAYGFAIYNFHFDPQYAADDHRAAVDYIAERIAPGDAVLINAGYAYPPFLYYFQENVAWRGRLVDYEPDVAQDEGIVILQTGVIGGDEGLGWGDPQSDFYATSEGETAQALERVFAHHPRLWVYRIYDTVTDPQGFIRGWLDDHGRMIGDRVFAGESYMRVQCYLTALEPDYSIEVTYHPLEAAFGNELSLLGYESPQAVRSANSLPLTLYWQAHEQLKSDFNLILRLRASDGHEFARLDGPLSPPPTEWGVRETVSQTVSLAIPAGTPPTAYELTAEVYDPSTGRSLAPAKAGLSLGTVTVHTPLVPRRAPPMTHEPWANFGNLLQLAGFELEPLEIAPGDQLDLELLWRAWDAPLPLVHMVIRLTSTDSQVDVGQWTSYLGNDYRSVLWEKEELVRDVRTLEIPDTAPPGRYVVTVTLQRISSMGEAPGAQGAQILPFEPPSGPAQESFPLGEVQVVAE
jgi:mannosyltransferase